MAQEVIVATIRGVQSSASLALRAEGIEHERAELGDGLGYWHLISRHWRKGEGFVLLEHDVVPWPGAVALLAECPEDWCVHEYPYSEPPELIWALGAWKVSAAFTAAHSLPTRVRWDGLDHYARGVLRDDAGPPHVHRPPFAHARLKDRGV